MRIAIIGAGYVGGLCAHRLAQAGHQVWALKRTPPRDQDTSNLHWKACDVLGDDFTTLLTEIDPTHIVYSLPARPPSRDPEQHYLNGIKRLSTHAASLTSLRQVLLTSSTGIYAHQREEQVDESTEIIMSNERISHLHEAEQCVLDIPGVNTSILRLSGIYGVGRHQRLMRMIAGDTALKTSSAWSNRIHQVDAARAIEHVIHLQNPESHYVVSDTQPARLDEIAHWVYQTFSDYRTHIIKSKMIDPTQYTLASGSIRQRREQGDTPERQGKRCNSTRLVESGFAFTHPSYQIGYGAIVEHLEHYGIIKANV